VDRKNYLEFSSQGKAYKGLFSLLIFVFALLRLISFRFGKRPVFLPEFGTVNEADWAGDFDGLFFDLTFLFHGESSLNGS
jgi:hypothetical protein